VDEAYRAQISSLADRLVLEPADEARYFSVSAIPELEACLDDFDILITVHSVVAEVARLFESVHGRIPTLTLQDEILEHRHCWEKKGRSIQRYRPVLSDKIAVFGERSRALLLAWGNPEQKISVTGAARFDAYCAHAAQDSGPILLACGDTPFLDKSEDDELFAMFDELIKVCSAGNIPFRFRMPEKVRRRVLASAGDFPILRTLCMSDATVEPSPQDVITAGAVVTTPSTGALEAMAAGKAVALLHPRDVTVYLSAAWNIRRPQDMRTVLRELLAPPAEKLMYQSVILGENLLVATDATANIVELIRSMAAGRVRDPVSA